MIDFILTALAISWVCMGLYVCSEEDMLLERLRKPFNRLYDKHEVDKKMRKDDYTGFEYWRNELTIFALKPVIGCPICMASFWTVLIHTTLHGYEHSYWIVMAPMMLCVAFLNALWLGIYHKL